MPIELIKEKKTALTVYCSLVNGSQSKPKCNMSDPLGKPAIGKIGKIGGGTWKRIIKTEFNHLNAFLFSPPTFLMDFSISFQLSLFPRYGTFPRNLSPCRYI